MCDRWTINLALKTTSEILRVKSLVDSGDLYMVSACPGNHTHKHKNQSYNLPWVNVFTSHGYEYGGTYQLKIIFLSMS